MLYLKRKFKLHRLLDDVPPGGPPGDGGAPPAAPQKGGDTPPPAPKGGDTPPPKGGDTPPDDKGFWADGWRDRLAGEDKAEAKRLARFASPEEIYKSFKSLESRMSRGELKSQLPKDADEAAVKAWRAENGLPESPDKYDVKGVVPEKADQEIIGTFLKAAHATNQTPAQVQANLKTFYEVQEQITTKRMEQDAKDSEAAITSLRDEYGAEYTKNKNMVFGLLDKVCTPAMKKELISARMGNGKGIFNDPEMFKVFVNLALIDNPAGIVVPGGGDVSKAMNDEIAEIEGKMGTKAYVNSEKMQARYRELIDAREAMKDRSKK